MKAFTLMLEVNNISDEIRMVIFSKDIFSKSEWCDLHVGKNRFSGEITGKFGREGYAFEVFIAELGSAFPVADLGIVGEGQHDSYIASWLKAFEERHTLYFQRRQRGVKSALLFDG